MEAALDRPRPSTPKGVQNLLELVVINLILNAFQAMPNGGRLTIGVWREGARSRHRDRRHRSGDTGSHVSKIFDPFFTTRNDSRRSGLGLSVSHSIVRQHGGGVSVRTSPSSGTTFVVRIPVARELSRRRRLEKAS